LGRIAILQGEIRSDVTCQRYLEIGKSVAAARPKKKKKKNEQAVKDPASTISLDSSELLKYQRQGSVHKEPDIPR
jgi:hypothetical protein